MGSEMCIRDSSNRGWGLFVKNQEALRFLETVRGVGEQVLVVDYDTVQVKDANHVSHVSIFKSQCNKLYTPVPQKYPEITARFYDDQGIRLEERTDVTQKGSVFKTLQRKGDPNWWLVRKIKYSCGSKPVREVLFLDKDVGSEAVETVHTISDKALNIHRTFVQPLSVLGASVARNSPEAGGHDQMKRKNDKYWQRQQQELASLATQYFMFGHRVAFFEFFSGL